MATNPCVGCKYDTACGDPERTKPCAGRVARRSAGGLPTEKLTATAKLPTRGSTDAAGLDFYIDSVELRDMDDPFTKGYYTPTLIDGTYITLEPYQKFKIHTGIACAIPEGCVGLLFNRSGIALKQDLRLANCVGVIDADYRGEIVGVFQSDCPECQTIELGSRAMQLVIVPYLLLDPMLVGKLPDTDRGTGGFGSTGTT
jgi:dUTP pyrophosphatase